MVILWVSNSSLGAPTTASLAAAGSTAEADQGDRGRQVQGLVGERQHIRRDDDLRGELQRRRRAHVVGQFKEPGGPAVFGWRNPRRVLSTMIGLDRRADKGGAQGGEAEVACLGVGRQPQQHALRPTNGITCNAPSARRIQENRGGRRSLTISQWKAAAVSRTSVPYML